MSARYGSRTRSGQPVGDFGRAGGAGGGGAEVTASFSPAPAASVAPITIDGIEYQVATVTASTTVTFGAPATAVGNVLIVAGGGPGNQISGFPGYPGSHYSGGGGGGGLIETAVSLGSGPYPLVVGGGGSPSSGFGYTLTAGGAGGAYTYGGAQTGTGYPGGSGGGGGGNSTYAPTRPGGTGVSSPYIQGFDGRPTVTSSKSGGGGGAGEKGGAPLTSYEGGNGRLSSITGTQAYYGGGGNGTDLMPNPPNPGVYLRYPAPGRGGGGAAGGNYTPVQPGLPGDANTGGGGGGACGNSPPTAVRYGGTGGSGIVIIRWQKVQA